MRYEFEIPGKPFGKQRPKHNTKSGVTYTPKETTNYENLVKICFREKYPEHIPSGYPAELRISASFPIPKSWSKKKQKMALEGEIYPGKPDWDNVGKIISDALNEIAYKDDAQVHTCLVTKRYSDNPCVRVSMLIRDGEDDE